MTIKNLSEMDTEAARFIRALVPRSDGATIVTLSGELGAGKTAFVKGAAKALGVTEHVTSPTFVIMKIYDLVGQSFKRLIHMDAYRLKGEKHLKVLGWDELIRDPENLILIEWPEMVGNGIPPDVIRLQFAYDGETARSVVGI